VLWPDYSMPHLGDECAAPFHDRLKLRYADRKKTELHAIVRPEKNEVILNVFMGNGWSFPRQREPAALTRVVCTCLVASAIDF